MPRLMYDPPVYVGVDPGQRGGLASIVGVDIAAAPMPDTERDIWSWISGLKARWVGKSVFAYIEAVNRGFPGTSKANMALLYGNYTAVCMALTAADVPYERITSQQWQKGLGIKKPKDYKQGKKVLRAQAQRLFPTVEVTDGVADALLICEYCRRKREGKL